ncbi:hypothetical protein TELCIR_01709 [Teladorsagia circumcincta]|uniref:Abnormal cell migration protein 18-like fibronectin type I domain-containing protein n=1 Tax=Teladorsagia circumcincta TaxID=45464 RepID=A0A2G9V3C8_TELCI|nr:hypothetical protein TELCIR_01709 [Teladorsagia circumcincta]
MKLLLLCLCVGSALATQCEYKGIKHSNGETWAEGSFRMKCVADDNGWRLSIAACLTEQNTPVSVGGSIVEDGKKYECTDQGGGQAGVGIDLADDGVEYTCSRGNNEGNADVGIDLTDDGVEYTCSKGNNEGNVNFRWKAV